MVMPITSWSRAARLPGGGALPWVTAKPWDAAAALIGMLLGVE